MALIENAKLAIDKALVNKKYYFTFGMNQQTKDGISLGNFYVCIEAKDINSARFHMFDARGSSWSFCYTEDEFSGQPEKYGLKALTLEQVRLI